MELAFPENTCERPLDQDLAQGKYCNFCVFRGKGGRLMTMILDICRILSDEIALNGIALANYIDCGSSVQSKDGLQEETSWNLVYGTKPFERPEDLAESDHVLKEVAQIIAKARRQARERLGYPLAAQETN